MKNGHRVILASGPGFELGGVHPTLTTTLMRVRIISIEVRGGRASQVTAGIPMHATNENAPPPRSLFMKLFVRLSWEYRYRRLFWGVRRVSGLVLFGLGMFVLSYGSWWALPFLAGAAANFFGGYRIYQITQSQPPT